jgi:predicted transcriptional regulator
MDHPSLGDQELEVLRFIADHAPMTAREIVEGYGEEHGLARTTVLTVVERLRQKGYLSRKKRQGVYQYSPRVSASEVLQGVVRQFVEKTLGGSVSPVVAYLAKGRSLSDEDLKELEQLVEELKTHRKEGDS